MSRSASCESRADRANVSTTWLRVETRRMARLLDRLHTVVPFELEIAPQSPDVVVREIDVRRIQDEFAFEARDVLDDLPRLAEAFRAERV